MSRSNKALRLKISDPSLTTDQRLCIILFFISCFSTFVEWHKPSTDPMSDLHLAFSPRSLFPFGVLFFSIFSLPHQFQVYGSRDQGSWYLFFRSTHLAPIDPTIFANHQAYLSRHFCFGHSARPLDFVVFWLSLRSTRLQAQAQA